jgi:limonene-1,2-epoxide hydrolase
MEVVEKFKQYFVEINDSKETLLREIYADHVFFQDPIHEIQGIEPLILYFRKLNRNLIEGSFQFTSESLVDAKAFLTWEMKLKLKRPNQTVTASGISVLAIENKIIHQRDYFDAGELFYEHVPILGGVIRRLKRNLAVSK